MEASHSNFDHIKSDERIQEILDSAETFDEFDDIPSRNQLTYSNGFYVNCTALFIDIRGSTELTAKHTRPVMGKLYRAYLSECVAIMNGDSLCREVFINGDCVSGIFSTPYESNIDDVFSSAARLHSATRILNWRLKKKGYATFTCGIGMAYGRALMLKAGHKGSGINDVIWMGDVVNKASNLCHDGNRSFNKPQQIAIDVYNNLNEHNKSLLHAKDFWPTTQYEGNFIDPTMETYLTELQQKS